MDDILAVMDVAHPYATVCPTLDGEVLRVLAGTTRLLTGREVARLTGRTSHSGILDVLNRLTEHGLVTRVELNRASLFALNRDHLAVPAVNILMGMREALLSRLRTEIASWEIAPIQVSLFGSAARGDGDTRSDIDLLVIRPDDVDEEEPSWRSQIDGLSDRVQRWTGNYAGIVERSESQIAQMRADELPFLAKFRADAIIVGGSELPALSTTA